jgi:hypothetical protein
VAHYERARVHRLETGHPLPTFDFGLSTFDQNPVLREKNKPSAVDRVFYGL